jgi:hypothetical protein
VFTVNLMTPMHAIAANNPVQAGSNGGHGVFRFAENPDLDHVAGFPIVAGGGKPGRDDHTGVIFVKDKSVHRVPPRLSMMATRAIRRRKPRAQSGPWKRGGMWNFMGLAGGGLKGALDFHL